MNANVARFASDPPRTAIEKMCYGGRPTTLVIGRDGRVLKRIIGARAYEDFSEVLTSVSRTATLRAVLR